MTNSNFFKGIATLEELKRTYRKLAMMFHPDHGGNEETFKALSNEYTDLFNILKNNWNEGKTEEQQMTECPEEFIEIIAAIQDLEGLDIELCGSWVWVSGDTKTHKDALKEIGFKWASKKLMWYWRSEENRTTSRKSKSMSDIRSKYGSDKVFIPKGLK